MKATGIVRRIDDLGRIVIPKEIRKTLKIHEGSPLEIFTDENSNVIFRKYSPIGEISRTAEIYASAISVAFSCGCVITDNDKVLAVGGTCKKECVNKNISNDLNRFITQRKIQVTTNSINVVDGCEMTSQIVCLIIGDGDPLGTIVIFGIKENQIEEITKLVKVVSSLLGKQTE